MSAEPLTREERDILLSHLVYPSRNPATVDWDGEQYPDELQLHQMWEATVQAVEAERDALARRVEWAEKVVGLFRVLDEDDAGPDEASYAQAWDMVADLIATLAADDAARGEQ